MKKLFLVSLLFPIAFFLVVSGCSKSSNNGNNSGSESRMTLITRSAWKYDTSGIDNNMDGIVDIGDTTIPACEKDNTYQFNADSTGLMNEGATKCNVNDPQTAAFTWSFNTAQTMLQSNFNPILVNGVNIFKLTDSTLVVYKDSTVFGISFRYLLSLKH
ncbi:MAG: hypothetical protein P4L51_26135 [Puia sp.]|nr:hypothetical protein [Puia sp.]